MRVFDKDNIKDKITYEKLLEDTKIGHHNIIDSKRCGSATDASKSNKSKIPKEYYAKN